MALAVQPKRAQRQLEYERGVHAVSLKLTAELEAVTGATGAEHAAELKAARAEHAAERLLLPPVMHPQPHLLNYEPHNEGQGSLIAKAHSSTMRAWAMPS